MARRRGTLETVVVGTVLVHVVLLTLLDIGGTWARHHKPAPEPEVIELDDTPPPPPPPPLPEIKPPPLPEPPPPKSEPVVHHEPVHVTTHAPAPVAHEPPPTNLPPPPPSTDTTPTPGGGDEPYQLPEGPTGGVAVPVAHGHGTGGTGGGTGGGSGPAVGAGSGSAPAPVSIAAIKTAAKPRGDYSYFGAGKDYPAAARTSGIEGTIRVRLVVDAHGKVVSRTLLNKLGYGLDELALDRAGQIEFEPAKDDRDQPVASVVVWTFTFTLPQ